MAQYGYAWTKLVVPSIGSIIQTGSFVNCNFSEVDSSPIKL